MSRERTRRLAAVWFADIVGYTSLSSRDEDGALAVVDELQRLAREAVGVHNGRIAKFVGDAVLTVFESTDAALKAAVALQESFAASEIVQQKRCALRIGMHVGEVVEAEDGDVYGDGVNLASRIESRAGAGQVVVSEDVYRQVKQRAEHELRSLGPVTLKGVTDPVRLYSVGESATSPASNAGTSQSGDADWELVSLQEALLGRYLLKREIGRGGMGVVYLAHEVRLDRPVALKLLPRHMAAQPVLRERFLQEALTAAQLSHPNIVPIYAVDEIDDFVFFAMAFVEGESLGERVREQGPVRPAEAARILREVAWALGYAHLHGIVHRDVKPDNILLESETGRALVTDFGIAHVGDNRGLTGATDMLGTAEFMSPEQAGGEGVDARSDLYSLGIVGHYMLSGELPFQGATVAATLAKQLTQEAPSLSSAAVEVPRALGDAVGRCLMKDPDERFQRADELADAVTDSLAVRRAVPAPLRLFAEKNRESTVLIWGMGFAGVLWLLMYATIVADDGFEAWHLTWAAVSLGAFAATPVVMFVRMARRLLRSGHSQGELVLSLRSEVDERRHELTSGDDVRSRIGQWAHRITLGGLLTFVAGVASFPFLPYEAIDLVLGIAGWSGIISAASGIVAAATGKWGVVVPGERWLRFWEGKMGRGIFRLAGLGLKGPGMAGASYGHTEMVIGLEADRLFEALPKDVQRSFSDLPEVVRALEEDAEGMRSHIAGLDALIAQAGAEGGSGSARVVASADLADRRDALVGELEEARQNADARLSEVVTALETIRLELLRMNAGAGSVGSLTADLTSAQELSEDVRRMVEGQEQVEKLLGDSNSAT